MKRSFEGISMENEAWRKINRPERPIDTFAMESACLQHMQRNGLPLRDSLKVDGKVHRYSIDEKRNQPDEWYIAWFNLDGPPSLVCAYGSWSTGDCFIFKSWEEGFRDERTSKETYETRNKKHLEQCEAEEQEKHKHSAQEAKRIWNEAPELPPTAAYLAYLKLKQVEPIGVRFARNPHGYESVIFPLCDVDGNIQSVQFISVDAATGRVHKTFLAGGKKSGNCFTLGDIAASPITFITEGGATGLTVYTGLKKRHATVVAFDAGNIRKVVPLLQAKYPNHTFVIAGDDDSAGRDAGDGAVSMHRCKVIYPRFPEGKELDGQGKRYTDFNDLSTVCGNQEVEQQLSAIIAAVQQEDKVGPSPEEGPISGESVVSVDPCACVDIAKLPSLMRDYINLSSETTQAHPVMILSAFLATVSAFVKKSVVITDEHYFQNLYANVWFLNVAESGAFKTTALNKGSKIARKRAELVDREIKKLYARRKDTPEEGHGEVDAAILRESLKNVVLPDKVTPEGLFAHLAQGHAGTIFASEFGAWLQNLEQKYNSDLKALFTVLYDVPETYSYMTRTQGNHVLVYPYVSICGVSTMPWLRDHIKPDDVSSGFFARFLILTPASKGDSLPDALPKQMSHEYLARYRQLEERIMQRLEATDNQVCFTLPQDCKDRFGTMHEEICTIANKYDERDRELLAPYIKRWGPYVLKIAMLMRLFEDDWNEQNTTLSIASLETAMMIVRAAMRSTIHLFASEFFESPHERACRRVLKWITKRETAMRTQLIASKVLRGGVQVYNPVLDTLIESGRLQVRQTDPKKKETWSYTFLKTWR